MNKALVCGAGGFIGHHLVRRLKSEGFWVRGVDIKRPRFSASDADDFIVGDLRDVAVCDAAVEPGMDEVYQLAADMGGAGYIFSGDHDADVMHNSALVNLNMLESCRQKNVKRLFYSSSACVYPEHNQLDPDSPVTAEDSVYPAAPDSEYGWEKLFSERMYLAYQRNYGLSVCVGRYHNIFGPDGRKRRRRCAERSPRRIKGVRSRSGETASRRALFSTSTSVSREHCGSCVQTGRAR